MVIKFQQVTMWEFSQEQQTVIQKYFLKLKSFYLKDGTLGEVAKRKLPLGLLFPWHYFFPLT